MSGLELVMKIKAAQPHVATLILTGHRSFDNAVEAIRVGADDFLTKPVDRPTLIEKINELAQLSARRKAESSSAVLAIGAHPDDVEVGCGGTLLGHVAQGHEVSVLVLTGGEAGGLPAERAREAARAAELMAVRLIHVNVGGDTVGEREAIVTEIARVLDEVRPDTIYTHSEHDFNQDHRSVHQATLAAAAVVPRIFCFESSSTTVEFQPSRFRCSRRVHGPQARRDPRLHHARPTASPPRRRAPARDEPLLEPLRPVALRRAVRGRARDHVRERRCRCERKPHRPRGRARRRSRRRLGH